MHPIHLPGTRRNHTVSRTGIQRLQLLDWRFSAAEVHRLSLLQMHYRDQPDVVDQPLDTTRLQFARWLAEHGRIGEQVDQVEADNEDPPWDDGSRSIAQKPARCSRSLHRSMAESPTDLPAVDANSEPTSERGLFQSAAPWYLTLHGVWSRLRQAIAGAKMGREQRIESESVCEQEETQEYSDYSRSDAACWELPYWGPYGWPCGSMCYFEIPPNWMQYWMQHKRS